MGRTRYDQDEDEDRDINTLIWHKKPVEYRETGPKGEKPEWGYKNKRNGKTYFTDKRGSISDEKGAPPRTEKDSEPIWLRPRLGAPDRVGKISRPKSKFFDSSIPRCNCTTTHEQDLKIDMGSKLDYRRYCPVHKVVEGAECGSLTGDDDVLVEDERGCNCESMYRADIKKKRDGRLEPQRRCRVHGPYHAPLSEQDEKEDSPLKQMLRSAARKIMGDGGDNSDSETDSDEDVFRHGKIDRVRPRSWAPPRTQTMSSSFFDEKMGAPGIPSTVASSLSSIRSPTFGSMRRSQSTRQKPTQLGVTPPIVGGGMRSPTFCAPMMAPLMRVNTKDSTDSYKSTRSTRTNGSTRSKYTISIGYEGDLPVEQQCMATPPSPTRAIPILPKSPGVKRSQSTRMMLHPPPRADSGVGMVDVPRSPKSPTGRARSGSNMYGMDARNRVQTMPFPGVADMHVPVPQQRGKKHRMAFYEEMPMM